MTEADRIAEWTARAQSGGEGAAEAFESLYSIYRKRVYYFCHCLLEDETAAVDATCSVFLYAWRNLRSMPAEQKFYPWICGNAFYFVKIALAGLRGTSVTVEEVEADPASFDEMSPVSEKVAPELSVRRSHLDTVTEQVLELPIADRICVMLHDYAQFPPDEVAAMAGCSTETVQCRVHNGHTAISAGLDARTPGDGEIFRPVLDKLIRTCGKNCAMPEEVTERIRAGLAEGREVELPVREEAAPAAKSKLPPVMINRICIILGFLFAGALVYILYWLMSSPSAPGAVSDESSFPVYESSAVVSSAVSEALSGDSSDVSDESIGTVSGDESEPGTSSDEESSGESTSSETSSATSSEASSEASSAESSSPPVLGELPRTTENLRMRTEPSTADPNNLVVMIPKGAHIDILETVTNEAGEVWYFARYTVRPGFWYEGYCSADYIQTEE